MTEAGWSPDDLKLARAELDAILSSKLFARASSLSKILQYVCEKAFRGEQDSIKEYNIAVEALGRDANFDPVNDSIVRVEAYRLRKRLAKYYETEGASHTFRIALSESGYIPLFQKVAAERAAPAPVAEPEPEPFAESPQPVPPVREARRFPARVAVLVGFLAAAALGGYLFRSQPEQAAEAAITAVPVTVPPGPEIRILCGSDSPKYIDSSGHIWLSDRYFTGGQTVGLPNRRIYRTLDQQIYRYARYGTFRYDIPALPGIYELRLHFAETNYGDENFESAGDGMRRFNVALNGQPVLTDFDIVTDSGGPNAATEKVFKNVSPDQDGAIHLEFTSNRVSSPIVMGIEVLPGIENRMRPVRILAGARVYIDRNENLWGADRYFLGGTVTTRTDEVTGPSEPQIYAAERCGQFNYAIPVAKGSHTVTLKFRESGFPVVNPARGPGQRTFDLYANGLVLLKNFDIFLEAGRNQALDKRFKGLKSNSQDKLVLSFVPTRNYACVAAIEVIDEGETSAARSRARP